jgi:hypothetical protein
MQEATMRTILALCACAALAGCVGWANYPPETGQTRFIDPNDRAMSTIISTSLGWAARKFPAHGRDPATSEARPGPFTVNLPAAVRTNVHDRILERIGHGVLPLTPETANLPTYHVLSMRVRGDEGQVNILRPVPEFGQAPAGGAIYQEVRIMLRGGVLPWRVTGFREWSPGSVVQVPAPNYYKGKETAGAE